MKRPNFFVPLIFQILISLGVMQVSHAQWSTATLSQGRTGLSATAVGTKVFFAGGWDGDAYSNVVDIYDNSTDNWSTATLSQARHLLSATAVGTKVFFAGGLLGSVYSDVVDIYDNSTNTWSTATLSQARYALSATSVGTKVFFAGGQHIGLTYSDVVDIYDNSTNTWSTAILSQARRHLSATSVGTKVFFAGGSGSGTSDVVDIYDNSTNTWSTATLSQARATLDATSVGTKVFFAGGSLITEYNVVDIYDNSTDTWSTATLSQARRLLSATSVGNKAFFAGGLLSGTSSNIIDIYDNGSDTWSTSTLSQPRYDLSATSVDAKVFFAGGGDGVIYSNVVDIFTDSTPPSTETDITDFSFAEQTGAATINATNHTVNIEVTFGTDVTALIATFTLSTGATAQVSTANQSSASTSNNFASPLTYTITAEDDTTQSWVVTVTVDDGLLAYYPFNGNANDESGNGNDGIVNGAVFTTDRFDNPNSVLSFDGINDNVSIPHDASLVPPNEISISMWINATDIQSTTFSRLYNKEDVDRHLLSFQNSGTILAFGLYINGSYNELDVGITPTDFEGSWVHLAAIYDGLFKRVYMNGVELGNVAISGSLGTSNTSDVYIGSATGGGEYFDGSIDDVQIYDRALTSSEVVKLFSEGTNFNTSFTQVTTGDIATDAGSFWGNAWLDIDNDDDLDLVANNDKLYINNSDGTFTKVTSGDILTNAGGIGVTGGDYDNDGFVDLFFVSSGGALLKNDNGIFTKVDGAITLTGPTDLQGASWADFNNDGKLDLFVTSGGNGIDGELNFLMQNNGDGSFSRVSTGDIGTDLGSSVCANWGDYDNDGDLDLFVGEANHNNVLYTNIDGELFRDNNNDIGTTPISNGGSGGSWADYNNDGYLDLFVTSVYAENVLFKNEGPPTYRLTKVTDSKFLFNLSNIYMGSTWGDLDNDGDLDLIITNQFSNNEIYSNLGDGTFEQILNDPIAVEVEGSLGISLGDYDKDGDLDVYYNSGGVPNRLFRNNGNNNNWINLNCIGIASNSSAIGARIRLKANINGVSYWQIREVSAQTGLMGQNSLNVEFGLGDATIIDSLEVFWPSGIHQLLKDISVNQFLNVIEPSIANDIITFGFSEEKGSASLIQVNHTVDIEVVYGTNLTDLIATFELSPGATAKIGSVTQVSGTTSNDYTNEVTYLVVAEDTFTTQEWKINVTVAPSNEANFVEYSFAEQTGTVIPDDVNHRIDIIVQNGTVLSGLIATFVISEGATINIAGTTQVSSVTSVNFNNPVTYTILAEDGTTSQEWIVYVTIASKIAPAITSFTPISGTIGTSVTINGANFDATPANNIVFFGATEASVTAATATELTVTVPVGATYHPITVLTNELLAYSSAPFVVTFAGGGIIDDNSFGSKVDYSTGSAPISVSISDLDGDGKADLAVANEISNSVSVLRNTSPNTGTINYANEVDYMTGITPFYVSVGDLDGDGKADLVVANVISGTVSVLRNKGTTSGTISYSPKVDYTTGTTPYSVAIGDLDGDGKADLAVANNSDNTVSVFRNTSTSAGIISYATKMDFATGLSPWPIAIGDLDGDGKADLAVANETDNTLSVLRNTSTSADIISFAAKVDYTTGLGPKSISIGDLDGDGRADLAVTNDGSNTISVFRNTSSNVGVISYDSKVDYTTGINPRSVSIGDLNGDGKPDLAVANQGSNTVSVFMNTSTSTGTVSYATKVDYTTGSVPFSVSLGDMDGDGKADIVAANNSGNTVSVFRNTIVTTPTISSFAPKRGAIGTEVVIASTSPSSVVSNNTVAFNGTTAMITSATSTSITVVVPSGATTGVITLTVGGQTATSAEDFLVVPTIDFTDFQDDYESGTEPTANITFIDATDINKVDLMYKGISEDSDSWEPLEATQDGNAYNATIAADDMIGTEFYFRVLHNTTLELLSDSGIAYINYPITSTQQALPGLSFGDQVANYQIIAVPLELSNNNVTSVFSSLMPYDKTLWRLFDYNGNNREYNAFSNIDIGKGYWLIARNSTVINPGSGSTPKVNESNPFTISLASGWNLIGNPYNFRISWTDVLTANGNPSDIGEMKTFSGGTLSTSTTLDKYRGGFVFNSGSATSIEIPVINPNLGGRYAAGEKPADLGEKHWELSLNLTHGVLKNQLGAIGMHPEATIIGKDAFDEVSVPLIEGMGFFELGFTHPEYNAKFSKEVVPSIGQYTWEVEVHRDAQNVPITLSWNNRDFGENENQLYMFNPSTLEVINMRDMSHVELGRTTTKFLVLFGKQSYVDEQLEGVTPLLGEPYPNPTTYQISYPFRILKGDTQTVKLSVYDSTGKFVGQLSKAYQEGYHQLNWQFDHQGMYFLRLQIGNNMKRNKIIVR